MGWETPLSLSVCQLGCLDFCLVWLESVRPAIERIRGGHKVSMDNLKEKDAFCM